MSEIAEMMLDGTLCEACGVAFGPDHISPGHPVYCSRQCALDRGAEWHGPIFDVDQIKCPECGKVFAKKADRRQHIKMKHGDINE